MVICENILLLMELVGEEVILLFSLKHEIYMDIMSTFIYHLVMLLISYTKI